MNLKEAWLKIKEMENSERFHPNQIYSILSDLGVFTINPEFRLIVKIALMNDLWSVILLPKLTQNDINLLHSKLSFEGFSEERIHDLIASFYDHSKHSVLNNEANFRNSWTLVSGTVRKFKKEEIEEIHSIRIFQVEKDDDEYWFIYVRLKENSEWDDIIFYPDERLINKAEHGDYIDPTKFVWCKQTDGETIREVAYGLIIGK